jgi:hypothetical protein
MSITTITKTRPSGHIWMHAEQFFNAAELLWDTETGDITKLLLPMVVNYALAAELAMKAAEGVTTYGDEVDLLVDGQVVGSVIGAATLKSAASGPGHALPKIFARLRQDVQTDISQEFKSATGEELAPLLAKCSDYFIYARYAYEQKVGFYDVGAVRTLADGLLKAVMAHGLKQPR